MTTKKILTIFILIFICSTKSFGQEDHFVRDSALYDRLYNHLILKIRDYTEDSSGQMVKDVGSYKRHKIVIVSWNLKSDSIKYFKNDFGVYACRFACLDCGSDIEFYLKYHDKTVFIDTDIKTYDIDKIMTEVNNYFIQNKDKFNDIDRINTYDNLLRYVRRKIDPYNKFHR